MSQSAKPIEKHPVLSFTRMDIERRFLFPAGRFTQAGPVMPLLLAALSTVSFFAILIPLKDTRIAESFTQRGAIPYATVFFSFYALMILFVKWRKVAVQQQALRHRVVPEDVDFVLSDENVDEVLGRIVELTDDPKRFILFNRIDIALANLRNMGQIGDVDEVLRSQAENDESMMESSYTVVRGLIWAIPVLGFIGTVLGLTEAIGAFGGVLAESSNMETIKPALQRVTAGLATAFETTLQALIAAVVIQMILTFLKRSEERMFDAFMEYCQRQVVGRLRIRREPAPTGDA